MIDTFSYASPLGPILLAEREGALAGLWFRDQKHFFTPFLGEATREAATPLLTRTADFLDRYFRGERPSPDEIPLFPKGTPFQKEVWRLLSAIPYGEVTSYGALAKEMARTLGLPHMSPRAVGNAVGRNPISILIPCHRVLGADLRLTGYAGGLERKKQLLALEGIEFARTGR